MAIPTRFNMGQVQGSGADYFLRLLQEQGGAGARPSASITGGLPTARRGTPIPLMRKRPPMPEIGLRGIRDISALPAGGGMTSLQRDLAAKMGFGAQKPPPPKAPQSLMDRLTPAVGTPAFAGLSEAAATGLQLSGYQDKPITTGQGLGAMFSAGMKAYQEQKRADLADKIAMAELQTERAKAGLPYQGTSMDAQDRNIVLSLSDKVRNNTASETERAMYRMSLSRLTQPKTIKSYGEGGEEIITQVPPVDVGGAFVPEDMKKETQQSTKPTSLQQAQMKRTKALQQSVGLINKFRKALISAKDSGLYEGLSSYAEGALPSEEMVNLLNLSKDVQLTIKEMEELGALVGGDFAILEALVMSPNSMDAIRLGVDVQLRQLDNLEEKLMSRIGAAQELSGVPSDKRLNFQGTFRYPFSVSSQEDVGKLPPNSYFIATDDPDGTIRFKGAM